MSPCAIVTGVRGQDGHYLSGWLLGRGYRVVGVTRDAAASGVPAGVEAVALDMTDAAAVEALVARVRPDEIYNLAARASSATLDEDPVLTLGVNGIAPVRWLEAIRRVCPSVRFCQASSSEVFGWAAESPQSETTPFRPRNAYGAAKQYAQTMVVVYRQRFGLHAGSAMLFNHESPRRGPEFVTQKVCRAAAAAALGQGGQVVLGDLEGRRDWGYAGDYVRALWLMLQQDQPDDYVIASGRTHSVRELCELAYGHVGLDYRDFVRIDPQFVRAPETVELRGDPARARRVLGWEPQTGFAAMVCGMVDAARAAVSADISQGELS